VNTGRTSRFAGYLGFKLDQLPRRGGPGGLQYSRFLLVMLTQIALSTAFIVIGIMTRKDPRNHRTAM